MSDYISRDCEHLLSRARILFPEATINLIYAPNEVIHIELDNHRYTFEIGSDDDAYIFTDGVSAFSISLMDFDEDL